MKHSNCFELIFTLAYIEGLLFGLLKTLMNKTAMAGSAMLHRQPEARVQTSGILEAPDPKDPKLKIPIQRS